MENKQTIVALLVTILFAGIILSSFNVAGQSSAGEIRVDPGEVSLQEGESKTLEINYDSLSTANPEGIEFVVEYDPDVITVTDVSEGEYLSGGFGSKNISSGRVGFGRTKSGPVNQDSGTVATITIELADGVSQGDKTNITFTSVTSIGVEGTPETIDGTVEAADDTEEEQKYPPEYNVQIEETKISKTTVDNSKSNHTLTFNVRNVSTDGKSDNFTVKIPDQVTVEDITKTTVTERGTNNAVELTGDDPTEDPTPGNKINFAVNPSTVSEPQDLRVEVIMELSATP